MSFYGAQLQGRTVWDASMERFVHRENMLHLRKLLSESTDDGRRRQILQLLAEEEAEDHLPPDKEK